MTPYPDSFGTMGGVSTRLREAVQFTRQGRATIRQVFVGGFLVATWWAILPAAAVAGFLVEMLDTTASGRFEAPTFDDWAGLVVAGGPALVVTLCYAALPLAGLAWAVTQTVSLPTSGYVPAVSVSPIAVAVAVGCALFLAASVPTAATAYARERRLVAAFSPGHLLPVLGDPVYLGTALAVAVIGVVLAVLTTLVVFLTFGSALLVAPLILFYYLVLACYAVGTAYGEAVGDVHPTDRGPTQFDEYL